MAHLVALALHDNAFELSQLPKEIETVLVP
jgi:hypothetical protein